VLAFCGTTSDLHIDLAVIDIVHFNKIIHHFMEYIFCMRNDDFNLIGTFIETVDMLFRRKQVAVVNTDHFIDPVSKLVAAVFLRNHQILFPNKLSIMQYQIHIHSLFPHFLQAN